jgi:hypothetical protein
LPRSEFPARKSKTGNIEVIARYLDLIVPKPFDGCEHRSFLWKGSDCAALLLHGFPGTPAEMRPLGTVLKNAGWTVQGLMLPGLGADIESLDQRTSPGLVGRAKTSRRRIEAVPLADSLGRLFR